MVRVGLSFGLGLMTLLLSNPDLTKNCSANNLHEILYLIDFFLLLRPEVTIFFL